MRYTRSARFAFAAFVAALILSAAALPAQRGLSDENIYEHLPQTIGAFDGVFDGRVIYVSDVINSTAKTSVRGRFPSSAYATIDEAIDRVAELRTAGTLAATDLVEIRVLPGHTGAEAVVDANLFDADIPNLWIRGYGTGTQRPKLTLSDDGAELVFDAANITFENFIVEQGVTALAQAISVTASADNLTLKDVEFTTAATYDDNTVDWINVASGADDLTLDGIRATFGNANTNQTVNLVEIAGPIARPVFKNFFVTANIATEIFNDTSTFWTHADLTDLGYINTSGTASLTDSGGTQISPALPDVFGSSWTAGVVSITMSATNGDTGDVDTLPDHELLAVTGDVRILLFPVVTTTITDAGGTGTLTFGNENDTDAYLTSITATDLAAGDLWIDTTAASTSGNPLDITVTGGADVGYTVGTEDLTGGTIAFYYWWAPVTTGGSVTAGDGTTDLTP